MRRLILLLLYIVGISLFLPSCMDLDDIEEQEEQGRKTLRSYLSVNSIKDSLVQGVYYVDRDTAKGVVKPTVNDFV